MINLISTVIIVFSISLIFSIFGKGGGEFYLPVLVTFLNIPYFTASATTVFLIFLQSISMITIFHFKNRLIDWGLAAIMSLTTGLSSFFGGFISLHVSPLYMKILFSIFLTISAWFILVEKKVMVNRFIFKPWNRKLNDIEYKINLDILLPISALVAFISGMIGISGGGIIVPLLVIVGGLPLRVAMGTNTFLILSSSSMSFIGKMIHGHINWKLNFILGVAIIIGSQIGSRLHIKIKDEVMKYAFFSILVLAAIWMILKTIF